MWVCEIEILIEIEREGQRVCVRETDSFSLPLAVAVSVLVGVLSAAASGPVQRSQPYGTVHLENSSPRPRILAILSSSAGMPGWRYQESATVRP